MRRKKIILIAISFIIIALFSAMIFNVCSNSKSEYFIQDKQHSIKVFIKKNNDGSSSIISSEGLDKKEHEISEWKLNYPVFHFECADINADGIDDILVGVIKPTRFDSISRKRIFIFKLFEGYVRPLWLGSRVSQPLQDFKVIHSKPINLIRTIELEENGNFLLAEYKWKGFGLIFVKYLIRNVNLTEARKVFNQINPNHENS